jgi:hypothetical protein
MGCPGPLGVWFAFLKQPALPGKAPQTKKKIKKIIAHIHTFISLTNKARSTKVEQLK